MIWKWTREKIQSLFIETVKKNHNLSQEQFFYQVFICTTFKKTKNDELDEDNNQDAVTSKEHWILVPKGMNCILRYPDDFAYARGMLILQKPWSKDNTLTCILKDHQKTISTFLTMIDYKEVPSRVTFQYHTAIKYACKTNRNTC